MAVKFEPYQCIMTHSTCFLHSAPLKEIKGILWHDCGCDNVWLCRFVQPYEGEKDYDEKIKKLGKNWYGNDWNHAYKRAGVNFFIGKFDDGTVGTVQTLPDGYQPWGCGTGSKGSCNNGWLQFEICQDSKTNKDYAKKTYEEGIRLTAWLCEKYNIDPMGYHTCNGVTVPNIICHWDSYKLNLGSGHGDVYDWYPKIIEKCIQESMDTVRRDVAALIEASKPKNGWVHDKDVWYYYIDDEKATDWQKINKEWYYFDAEGKMQTGWHTEGGKTYYLKGNGKMATGWLMIDDDWYLFASNGAMKRSCWKKSKGIWYYICDDGKLAIGWHEINGSIYYFNEAGDMAEKEWVYDFAHDGSDKKHYYWLSKNGKFQYTYIGDWHKKDDKWWFGDESKWFAKDEIIKIKGIFYKFDSDGYLVEDYTKLGAEEDPYTDNRM